MITGQHITLNRFLKFAELYHDMDGTEKLGEEDYAFFDGFKIVVFGWDRFGWDEQVYYGNTPVKLYVVCQKEAGTQKRMASRKNTWRVFSPDISVSEYHYFMMKNRFFSYLLKMTG